MRDAGARAADGESAADAPMRTRLLSARLLALQLRLRTSGEIVYRAQTGFTDPQRRVLTLVGNFDALTSVELAGLTGLQKAQISRALATLVAAGLIDRASLRAPLRLSDPGRAAFAKILALATARNAELTRGIAQEDIAWFAQETVALTERAKLMLAQEHGDDIDLDDEADPPLMPERFSPTDPTRPFGLMIVPPLLTLIANLQRSATIVYRRATGLSRFEWQLLSQIAEYVPVELSRVIDLIGRDKSQVGRTVQRLQRRGLVLRVGTRGRPALLDITEAARTIYGAMCALAIERDDRLLAQTGAADRLRYQRVIERLTGNADRQLQAARAASRAGPDAGGR